MFRSRPTVNVGIMCAHDAAAAAVGSRRESAALTLTAVSAALSPSLPSPYTDCKKAALTARLADMRGVRAALRE